MDPTKLVGIKSIAKSTLKENVNMLKRELSVLRTLDHPNVARFHETYEDGRYVHFVMEYCSGGDMLD
jgi:calcium-dependent protein kinase